MHEFQMMRQVVKMVEDLGSGHCGRPSVVRLQISSQSHLAEHSSQDLDRTFELAAHGTSVQGAKLEIYFIPVKGRCDTCGMSLIWSPSTCVCTECRSGNLEWENQPEVVLTQVEFVEASTP